MATTASVTGTRSSDTPGSWNSEKSTELAMEAKAPSSASSTGNRASQNCWMDRRPHFTARSNAGWAGAATCCQPARQSCTVPSCCANSAPSCGWSAWRGTAQTPRTSSLCSVLIARCSTSHSSGLLSSAAAGSELASW